MKYACTYAPVQVVNDSHFLVFTRIFIVSLREQKKKNVRSSITFKRTENTLNTLNDRYSGFYAVKHVRRSQLDTMSYEYNRYIIRRILR